jgi:hypothetical protein
MTRHTRGKGREASVAARQPSAPGSMTDTPGPSVDGSPPFHRRPSEEVVAIVDHRFVVQKVRADGEFAVARRVQRNGTSVQR